MSNVAQSQFIVKQVKVKYDRTSHSEVYDMISSFFPNTSADDWTPEIIFPFIPEGACTHKWHLNMRNEECKRRNPQPKKKSRKRRSAGKDNRKHNPAEAVTKRTTTDALFGRVVD